MRYVLLPELKQLPPGNPKPDRPHFEAMDSWHHADPSRVPKSGWLERASAEMDARFRIERANALKSFLSSIVHEPGPFRVSHGGYSGFDPAC